MKSSQKGAFLMARWVLLILILVGMLVLPVWLKRSHDDKEKQRITQEGQQAGVQSAFATQVVAPAEAQAITPRAIGFGLTFALRPPADNVPADVIALSCDGQPKPSDKPEKDACNPRQGDTSCSVVLPVLCLKPEALADPAALNTDPVSGWTAGVLGATAPVMGAILQSKEVADARCEKELGTGYRMADRHAGGDGLAMRGRSGQGVGAAGVTRYWVATKAEPGNCWDSAP